MLFREIVPFYSYNLTKEINTLYGKYGICDVKASGTRNNRYALKRYFIIKVNGYCSLRPEENLVELCTFQFLYCLK
jgi:hypothetical protein